MVINVIYTIYLYIKYYQHYINVSATYTNHEMLGALSRGPYIYVCIWMHTNKGM